MKILVPDSVRPPVEQCVKDVGVCWHLYPRAIVSCVINQDTGLYEALFDFKRDGIACLDKQRIGDDPDGGLRYRLQHGEMIALGLGVRFDFGDNFWYHGSISMRKLGLFRKLEIVNANNPIFANAKKEEVLAFIKNNGDSQWLSRNEALLQVHFTESLRCPKMDIVMC